MVDYIVAMQDLTTENQQILLVPDPFLFCRETCLGWPIEGTMENASKAGPCPPQHSHNCKKVGKRGRDHQLP